MSESLCYDGYNQSAHTEVSMTLRSANGGDEREVSPTLSHKPSALEPTAAIYPACADTLRRRNDGAVQPDKQNGAAFVAQSQCDLSQMRYIVRRLTPTEAERLMGLPSGYTIPRAVLKSPTNSSRSSSASTTPSAQSWRSTNTSPRQSRSPRTKSARGWRR